MRLTRCYDIRVNPHGTLYETVTMRSNDCSDKEEAEEDLLKQVEFLLTYAYKNCYAEESEQEPASIYLDDDDQVDQEEEEDIPWR